MNPKLSAFLAAALFAPLSPLQALAQQTQQPPWDCYGRPHMWGGGWGHFWMFPLFILFIVFVFVAIYFLSRRSGGRHHQWGPWPMMGPLSGPGRPWGDPTFSAMQILNERFAKGEIQKQEYEEKKATILASGQH